jgi:hypothetical protein
MKLKEFSHRAAARALLCDQLQEISARASLDPHLPQLVSLVLAIGKLCQGTLCAIGEIAGIIISARGSELEASASGCPQSSKAHGVHHELAHKLPILAVSLDAFLHNIRHHCSSSDPLLSVFKESLQSWI